MPQKGLLMPAKKLSNEHARLYGGSGEGRGFATPAGVPLKPDWITAKPIASAKWDEVIEELWAIPGLLTRLDGDALSLYCDAWQQYHDASALIAAHGMVAHSDKGGCYQHPAVGIANKAREQIIKIGGLYGLTPPSRETMTLPDVVDDEITRLING